MSLILLQKGVLDYFVFIYLRIFCMKNCTWSKVENVSKNAFRKTYCIRHEKKILVQKNLVLLPNPDLLRHKTIYYTKMYARILQKISQVILQYEKKNQEIHSAICENTFSMKTAAIFSEASFSSFRKLLPQFNFFSRKFIENFQIFSKYLWRIF